MVMAGVIHRGLHSTDAVGVAALRGADLNGEFLPRRVSTRIAERYQSSFTQAREAKPA